MRRREFLWLVGCSGVAAATPYSVFAQQALKVYRIAIVHPSNPIGDMTADGTSPPYRAFFQRLREFGYIEGENLSIERYSGQGRTEHFAELAGEVVHGNPDLIFVSASRLTRAMKAATNTIPVVALMGDPVAEGIVPSLARPGGNITGVTTDAGPEIMGKCLELLREMVPAASRVAYLASPGFWESPYATALREAAQSMKISLIGPPLGAPFQEEQYRRAFTSMVQHGADALVVSGQVENITNQRLIVELAQEARLPAIHPYPEFVNIGGLVAYGIDRRDMYRHAADQVNMIFKGMRPSEIPFYQPTNFALAINLKTAKKMGIEISPNLLAQADEVIE